MVWYELSTASCGANMNTFPLLWPSPHWPEKIQLLCAYLPCLVLVGVRNDSAAVSACALILLPSERCSGSREPGARNASSTQLAFLISMAGETIGSWQNLWIFVCY